jgi:hypothetical protein
MSEVITCKSRVNLGEEARARLLAWLSLCFLQARHEWLLTRLMLGWERRAVGCEEIKVLFKEVDQLMHS